jgi:hypothetical protein
MQILTPASVTPIAVYLARRAERPSATDVQIEFAVVLLHREREYRTMYSSRWSKADRPAPDPAGPFAPYDLTPAAARVLTASLAGRGADGVTGAMLPGDLFGLKASAALGLAATLRAVRTHRWGWLVQARVLSDLSRFGEAIAAAETANRLEADTLALAVIHEAAVLGAAGPDAVPDGEAIVRRARAKARRLAAGRGFGADWARRGIEALDERLRQRAVKIRSQVEGRAFTRFLNTERAFCESERRTALAGFRAAGVPPAVRALIPLARKFGVGDDPCRDLFIRRTPLAERRRAAARIRAAAPAIEAWLAAAGGPPYTGEAAAFFWLLQAAEDLTAD